MHFSKGKKNIQNIAKIKQTKAQIIFSHTKN